jgi:hypothetical protein
MSIFISIIVLQEYSVWLRAGWSGFNPRQGQRIFLLAQTDSGAHPASYPMGTERGKERPGRDADHSPPSSAEVKYE